MGHMNVRFYVARAIEGLAEVAAALGMPDAFQPRAGATSGCSSSISASCARRASTRRCT